MKRLDTLFILAGEASADLLGSEIMMSFGEETRYFGVGGLKMRGMGFDNLAPQESLMTLGLLDSLLSVPRLLALADELIAVILDRRPDAVLTIDAKAFSATFARRLKKAMAKNRLERTNYSSCGPDRLGLGRLAREKTKPFYRSPVVPFSLRAGIFYLSWPYR